MKGGFTSLLSVAASLSIALGALAPEVSASEGRRSFDEDHPPRIAVIGIRGGNGDTDRAAVEAEKSITRALKKFRIDVIDEHEAIRAAAGPGSNEEFEKGLTEARKLLKQGRKDYENFAKGVEVKLRKAAGLFETNIAGLTKPDELVETYLLLAQVFFATRRIEMAEEVLTRLVQIQPDFTLDLTKYPPRIVEFFNGVRTQTLASTKGQLKVVSTPGGAEVYLDAQLQGQTPRTLENLTNGVHTVVIRKTGYQPLVQTVEINSYRRADIDAQLKFDRHPNLHVLSLKQKVGDAAKVDAGLQDYVRQVARAADVDLLVMGVVAPKGRTGQDLSVRVYQPSGDEATDLRNFTLAGVFPDSLDDVAEALLVDAVQAGWMPDIAARRNVESGGGALDETAPWRAHAALNPGIAFGGNAINFPTGPAGGVRVGVARRLTARLIVNVESGFETRYEDGVTPVDGAGAALATSGTSDEALSLTYTKVPLEVGARYYWGIGTFAPYVSGGAGGHLAFLTAAEGMIDDSFTSKPGVGFSGYVGVGGDWALGIADGLFVEARIQAATSGISEMRYRVDGDTLQLDEAIPVESSILNGGLMLGYLRVF